MTCMPCQLLQNSNSKHSTTQRGSAAAATLVIIWISALHAPGLRGWGFLEGGIKYLIGPGAGLTRCVRCSTISKVYISK